MEVGRPVANVGKVEQVGHELVGVPPVRVGQEEGLGSGVLDSFHQHWQPLVLVHVLRRVGHGQLLELALHVNVVDSVPDVLEDTLEAHEEVAEFESLLGLLVLGRVGKVVHDTCQQVGLRQVEKRVENVDPVVVQLDELVRVLFGDLVPAKIIDIFKVNALL